MRPREVPKLRHGVPHPAAGVALHPRLTVSVVWALQPSVSGFVWKDEVSAVFLKQKQILSVFTVMNDIITTMFNKKFMEELFKPQELYSKKALRTVYDRLAHASIMRLNQASMDKVKWWSVWSSLCCTSVLFAGYCHLEAFCNKPLPIGFLCKNGSKMRKSVVVPDNSVP